MRNKAYRRHQVFRHRWRRLKEDRNQHYDDLKCPCWHDPKARAFFKEQPKRCSCSLCCNPRRSSWNGKECRTMQERRHLIEPLETP